MGAGRGISLDSVVWIPDFAGVLVCVAAVCLDSDIHVYGCGDGLVAVASKAGAGVWVASVLDRVYCYCRCSSGMAPLPVSYFLE